jgi:ABC superfamily ATP binding cassette transporter, ABC protein
MQNPIIIQVRGKTTGLMQVLKNEEKVKSISLRENEIRVGFTGSREDEAGLLESLVENGISLYSFYREQGSIEGVLFQKTQEERSLLSYERESDMD